jgi:lysophospholipid acyltransferase (LPLAT)-like uncharacterized protein
MAYRVDNVPKFRRPFWLAYSWVLGLGAWLLLNLLNATCRLKIERRSDLEDRENFIYSGWHEFSFLFGVVFVRSHRRQAWMQHPAAYMKPVHIALQLMGFRVVLGSVGEEGREAAATLVRLLKEGWSTVILPDGPSGPVRTLKKGVLHIALESQVPVVPVRFRAERAVRLRSWDRKLIPLPFTRISVVLDEPVIVTRSSFDDACKVLAKRMSGAVA